MAKSEQGISVNVDLLMNKYREIAAIDEKLDSITDAGGKRAIANAIVDETKDSWEKPVTSVIASLTGISDDRVLVGSYTALVKALRESFNERVDKFLTEQKESQGTEVVQLSADEISALTTQRRQLNEEFKALEQVLELFDMDTSNVPRPKKRTGSRGKRGPRVFSKYVFSIDGTERTASQNSLSSIANTVCKGEGFENDWKSGDLRTFLSEQGIDLTNPPDSFSVTLPNGKVLSAQKQEAGEDEEEEEDEVQEEEETE